jgi:acetylornithine deacetylase/succinyl-diaminopimelate desuccinylase-like protein
MLRQLSKELEKNPDAEFVDVQSEAEHVRVRTHAGKLQVDVTGPGESVHVACPIATIEDLAEEFAANRPGA